MNLKPLENYVIIKPEEPETETPGGIILTEAKKKNVTTGQVLAVGNGRVMESGERIPCNCNEGDVVMYPQFPTMEIEHDGETLIVLRDVDLIAVCS